LFRVALARNSSNASLHSSIGNISRICERSCATADDLS
jgi:hypothetical protein